MVTEGGSDDDRTGTWLRPDEAASRLGTTVEAVRSRIRRGSLASKRGNDGRIRVLVTAIEPDRSQPDDAPAATGHDGTADWLRVERNEALLEADHWRSVAEVERTGRVRAEAELETMRAMLAKTEARGDRLEAALVEARRPWL